MGAGNNNHIHDAPCLADEVDRKKKMHLLGLDCRAIEKHNALDDVFVRVLFRVFLLFPLDQQPVSRGQKFALQSESPAC